MSSQTTFYLTQHARTDVGRVRKRNEDAFGIGLPTTDAQERLLGALFVVADGVGGAVGGDLASRQAVDTAVRVYYSDEASNPRQAFARVVDEANQAVYQDSKGDGRATTMVALAITDKIAHFANVGDSRLYLVRNGALSQLSLDHSWVQEQVRAGLIDPELADNHPRGNIITRWLGQPDEVEPDLFTIGLESEDRLLLCTDGLFKHLSDEAILSIVRENEGKAAVDRLVEAANEAGGADNITVILIGVHEQVSARSVDDEREDTASHLLALPASPDATVEPRATLRHLPPPRPPRSQGRHLPQFLLPLLLLILIGGAIVGGALYMMDHIDGTIKLSFAPAALAIDGDGGLLLADSASASIYRYRTADLIDQSARVFGNNPSPSSRWPIPGASGALSATSITDLAVDSSGNIYVIDADSYRLIALSPRGENLWSRDLRSGLDTGVTPPGRIVGLAVADGGVFYLADSTGQVFRLGATGPMVSYALGRIWGEGGTTPEIRGLAVDGAGSLYLSNALSGRIMKLLPGGTTDAAWDGQLPGEASPRELFFSREKGQLFAADADGRLVWRLDSLGRAQVAVEKLWPQNTPLGAVQSLAFDQDGNLYLLEVRGAELRVIRPRG